MAAPEPPEDLVQLRRDFLTADERHTDLCHATTPDQEDDPEHDQQVRAAFNESAEFAAAIARHPWWATAGNRVDAEKALRAVADAGALS